MKKIIFYQSWFNTIGGVETMAYNWCFWLRNFFDIKVLYSGGDPKRLRKMSMLVDIEKYDKNKEYECDILIRNSVWGEVPTSIKADRKIEMRHANYKFLNDKGILMLQYKDMGIKEIVGCGEFVSQMSNLVLHDNPTTIKNILYPKRDTKKIIRLISCTRLDNFKGWDRMQQMMSMMKKANIKFEWNIFTDSKKPCNYEEVHFYKQRYDIWDYLVDADYTVLLSDSEGLPYTVQESLQYQVPCIVTDIGGCTELIKDGVNGYVVPLDMNFDINKILDIPKCEEYDNHALEDWLDYLGYTGEINKEKIIETMKEEEKMKVKVEAIMDFNDVEENELKYKVLPIGAKETQHIWECSLERAEYLEEHNAVKIIERIEEKKEEPKFKEIAKAEDIKVEYEEEDKPVFDARLEDVTKVEVKAVKPKKKKVEKKK
jgi:glycosyltransferase involved in cell wall biosynthesis